MKQFRGKSRSGLFATQTLTGHVIRGAVAFALLYLAIEQQDLHPEDDWTGRNHSTAS